jgi:AmiR/NasT family two-component response regulator
MRLRDDVIGALNVFGRPGDVIAPEDNRLIQSLADVATIAILHERALSRAELLTEQLQFALNSRIVIEQAKGAVARALHIGVDEAFAILRLHARSNRMRLTELARAVIDDRAAMDRLVRPKR